MATIVEDLGQELSSQKSVAHFLTLSRVLPETLAATDLRDITTMSREEVATCVRKAFDEPMVDTGHSGRPVTRTNGLVLKMAVFREEHEDGDVHFHVAVLLRQARVWTAVKRTLRQREYIAAHFSPSHTQFHSCVRYGHIPTTKKPIVDGEPISWSATEGWNSLDLFAESQQPWNAAVWKRRHEEAQKQASGGTAKKVRRVCKLDLTSLMLANQLTTKAAVLQYVQDHGTEEMQMFVHNHQKDLKEFIEQAEEWGRARADAAEERESAWHRMCRTADSPCPHGEECSYAKPLRSSCLKPLMMAMWTLSGTMAAS